MTSARSIRVQPSGPRTSVLRIALMLAALYAATCGFGGAQGAPAVANAGDFSISASRASMTLESGGTWALTVSVAAIDKFKASVKVSVSGLPQGVEASPATFSLAPGRAQKVTFSAGEGLLPEGSTITFTGKSGSLRHIAQVLFDLVVPGQDAHAPIRTRYVRTNLYYDPLSMQYVPPRFTVYDPALRQFFVSNAFLNEIDVFDAAREIQIGYIPVPLPWGLDISPLNGDLYAGTLVGDIYQINPRNFAIIKRYLSSSIGPTGFVATMALVLSDGRMALQGDFGGVDGDGGLAVWDPVKNTFDPGQYDKGGPCQYATGGPFVLTGDRTRVLSVSTGDSESICSYDAATGTSTYGTSPSLFAGEIFPTPDGKRFILLSGTDFLVFDARTVKLLGQFSAAGSNSGQSIGGAGAMSPDGKTLYLVPFDSGQVEAFDTTTFVQKGWAPGFLVNDAQQFVVASAIDETGLLAGATGHGVGFIDASSLQANPPTTILPAWVTLATGPLSGDTETVANGSAVGTGNASLSGIYVGDKPGLGASFTTTGAELPFVKVTTPPGNHEGPVDLTVKLSDGALAIYPEGFSYGPTILEVIPNAATAEGGQTGTIIGYGFGNSSSGFAVSVGGKSAAVTNVFGYPPYVPYPFPVTELQFTIPPGTDGEAVDVKVKTDFGSATAKGVFRYVAATEYFPLKDALQAGIYDERRDLYFFTGNKQIEVLSKTQGKWLEPIKLPGVTSKTQLLAISESPDGTKLAVSDYGGQAIYVLDPDHPSGVKRFPMPQILIKLGTLTPSGLAVTNEGAVYFEAPDPSGPPASAFHKLDTSTGVTTDLGIADSAGGQDEFCRVLLSPDGSRVYINIDGGGEWADTSDDQVHFPATFSAIGGYFPELSLSRDGSTLDVDGEFADPFLNPQTAPAYVDWETFFPTAVNGQKLNQDGSILFQPLTDGIDMIARNTGRLLYRIQVSEPPAAVYDPLLLGHGRNSLAVISTTGVSFANLSSLPIPAADTAPFLGATEADSTQLTGRETAAKPNRSAAYRSVPLRAPRLRHFTNLESTVVSVKTQ